MKPAHRTFEVFMDLERVLGRSLTFVSEDTPFRYHYYRWFPSRWLRQVAYQLFKACDMAMAVLRAPRTVAIFIFEHKPQYSLPLYAACLLRNQPVFFFVHGIQQIGYRSPVHLAGLRLIQWIVRHFRFWPLHLELDDRVLPPRDRFARSIQLAHPLPRQSFAERAPLGGRKVRIGVVGMLRPDKPILPLIEQLSEFIQVQTDLELVVGTPFWQRSPDLVERSFTLVDTTTPEQYAALLDSLDIVVTAFDRDSFYFRPSGVINDAVAAGCYVLAPHFPVFMSQLSTPCRVGRTYTDDTDLVAVLTEAVADLHEGAVDFNAWRKHRTSEKLLNELGSRISEVLMEGENMPDSKKSLKV